MISDFKNKTAVITGAGSGFGLECARIGAALGMNLVLADVQQDALDRAAAEMTAAGAPVLAMRVDVSKADQVEALGAATLARFGAPNFVFNNAGVGAPPVPLDELTIEQWRNVVDINLNGMFYCLQQAFVAMKAQSPQGGRIINNGSISAYAPRPNSIAYTATKHAVTGLTKTAALDGRKYGIAVGQIDIGSLDQ